MKEDVQEPAWAAILSLTLGTFALVTSEFLPASLLSPMAADLHISEGVAGPGRDGYGTRRGARRADNSDRHPAVRSTPRDVDP